MKKMLLGLVALTIVALAPAQEITAHSLLSDESKATLKVGDLKPTHRAFKITMAGGGGGGFMDMVMGMFRGFGAALGGQEQSKDQEVGAKLLTAIDLFWTEGQTVKMNGKDFLVAYRYELELSAMQASGPPKLGPETAMNLTLINMENVATVSPRPAMTREAFWKILKDVAELPPAGGSGLPIGAAPIESLPDAPTMPADEEIRGDVQKGLSNAKQVAIGAILYASDYDDQMPYVQSTASVRAVTLPYTKNSEIWATHNPKGSRFLFNMKLAGARMGEIENPSLVPMFYESQAWPDGSRIVAFADGSARLVGAAEWPMIGIALEWKFKRHGKPLPADWMFEELRRMGIDPNG